MMFLSMKSFGRLIIGGMGFLYDYFRFIKFSGWKSNINDYKVRNYHTVKIYHALEKSMSYKHRDPGRGWESAFLLLDVIKKSDINGEVAFHNLAGVEILREFIKLPVNEGTHKALQIKNELNLLSFSKSYSVPGGIKSFSRNQFHTGKLDRPEDFFLSRFSLREFESKSVDLDVVRRAISLAIKAPSVCNRQPWHIYHTDNRSVIDCALRIQSGNSGFGHKVPNLAIITVDLKAFMPGNEHYQHWIEGGIISMSLIHAFHSLGVASCCLNWSQSPQNDIKLRSEISIQGEHTVIMMLAYGWPCKDNNVCISVRKSTKEYETKMEMK